MSLFREELHSINVRTFIFSFLGLCFVVLSYFMSRLAVLRDTGRLGVKIYMGSIHVLSSMKKERTVVHIEVVNTGRRNVTLSSVGGKTANHRLRAVLRVLTFGKVQTRGYVFMGPEARSLLFGADNQRRVLHEGEVATMQIELPDDAEKVSAFMKNSGTFGVTDTTGREYLVRSSQLKTLKRHLRDHAQSITKAADKSRSPLQS
jgi:hypothetical protein